MRAVNASSWEFLEWRSTKVNPPNLYILLPHCAARGDIEAVKSMLAKGADVDAVVAEHGTLEAMARANGKEKMATYLQTIGH
jgi:hypothetical protein